jgi:peptide-methionine (R)-S-oxide reductase
MSDSETRADKVVKSDAEWKSQLSPEQYYITRQHGTERAFTHPYNALKAAGLYTCVACSEPLFASDTKFDSGTGWPSFYKPIGALAVSEHEDRALFMRRVEVRCSRCDAHLGHVFEDGPKPAGLRYCINGAALRHEPKQDK